MRKILLITIFLLSGIWSFGQGTCNTGSCLGASQIRTDTTLNGSSTNQLCVDTNIIGTRRWVDSLVAGSGGGTVTSVGLNVSNGILRSGSTPITTSGVWGLQVDSSKYGTLTAVHDSVITKCDSLKRNAGTDSVFCKKNGVWYFQYLDSIGASLTIGNLTSPTSVLSVTNGTGAVVGTGTQVYLIKANIDTVGTVKSGTWQGTSIDTTYLKAVSKLIGGTNISVTLFGKAYQVNVINNGSMFYADSVYYHGNLNITTVGTLISGAIGSGFTAIPNSALAHSTISGAALGTNLDSLKTLSGSGILFGAASYYNGIASDTISVDSTVYLTVPHGFVGPIVDTTLSMTGWISYTGKRYYVHWYNPISRQCIICVAIAGTSNATTTSITLPFAFASVGNTPAQVGFGQNNGSYITTVVALSTAGSATLNFYPTNALSTWGSSGGKIIGVASWTYQY